jgi:hypothetical protein
MQPTIGLGGTSGTVLGRYPVTVIGGQVKDPGMAIVLKVVVSIGLKSDNSVTRQSLGGQEF